MTRTRIRNKKLEVYKLQLFFLSKYCRTYICTSQSPAHTRAGNVACPNRKGRGDKLSHVQYVLKAIKKAIGIKLGRVLNGCK